MKNGTDKNYPVRTRLTPTRHTKIVSTESPKIFLTSRVSDSIGTTQDPISTITNTAINDYMSITTLRTTTNTTPRSTMNTTASSNIKYLQESGKFRFVQIL